MIEDLVAIKQSVGKAHFDPKLIKKDFPILNQQVHGYPLVYLDNAATTQKPLSVIQTIDAFYRESNANVHRGVHYLSSKSTIAFDKAREKVKQFIHAKSTKEIIFTRGTTEAINLVAQSYGRTFLKAGDEILISAMEHHANIVPWQLLCQQIGTILKVLPMNDDGELILDNLGNMLTEKTKFVSIAHISNALGTINDIKKIIDAAHAYDIPVLIDGAQAAPHSQLDMQTLDCDFYCFSSHKMYGPSGIGVLYGKENLLEKMPPYQGGGEMIKVVTFEKTIFHDLPYKFEAGTPNIEGVIGLGAAIDYIQNLGPQNIAAYEKHLLQYATKKYEQFSDLRLIGTAKNKAPILSFLVANIHAHDIGTILDTYGVAVRTGHHCAMPVMKHFNIAATTRASFAFYNTEQDVDQLFYALQKAREVFHS